MTVCCPPIERRPFNPLPLIILTGAVALVIMLFAYKPHNADLKHGWEAQAARDCVKKNGTFQVWRERNGSFHLLCMDGGHIFDWVRTPDGYEKTAFRPDPDFLGNTINNISRWLRAKGATLFKGPLSFDPTILPK